MPTVPAERTALQNPDSRRLRRWLLAAGAVLASLALPVAALGHVTIAPSYVEADVASTITFETPNERPRHVTVSLTIDAPPGVVLSAVAPPHGWKLDVQPTRARWSGGRIAGERTIGFPVRVLARTRAGNQVFRAVQGYEDGEQVRWPATLSVLPAAGAQAPSQHLGRAVAAGAAGLVVLAGSLLVLRRLRRRSLQER
jgi:hypothetical protein